MSTYTSTAWICDRCGRREVVGAGESPDQPINWVALYMIDPPRMSPLESNTRPDQVCGPCADAYRDWFTAGSLEPIAVPA